MQALMVVTVDDALGGPNGIVRNIERSKKIGRCNNIISSGTSCRRIILNLAGFPGGVVLINKS
jgi:hypothetical protein